MDAPRTSDSLTPPLPLEHRTAATLAEAFALGRLFEAHRLHLQAPSDHDLLELLEQTRRDFVLASARSDVDHRYLEALGVPAAIHPPQAYGLPSVAWKIPETMATDSWTRATQQWESLPDAPPIIPTQPFLVRDLADFPAGTRVLAITEPRHAASATTAEALRSQAEDLTRLPAVVEPADRYEALLRLRAWYAATTSIAHSRLAADHYRDWRPELALPLRYEQIAPEVARLGATALSYRVLTMRMASHCFAEHFELALQATPVGTDPGAHILAHLVSALESAMASNARVLDAFNLALAQAAGVPTAGCVLMEVHRTRQDDQPRLAVIPADAGAVVDLLRIGETGI